ncbi:alpha/beta hydrolase-fold protein [Spirosoma sp.]|uniref:alpha/beta hydrolase n=1 Tax=Spirosoma sp. TaxID=1899569 RepID=UPI00262B6F80|nr:alpha/beta hydrolase-fold protein [Spirosoma sp.]MCX6219285.1 alpha/beta hydrolase-fold protein [Spirosoma sp.]
MVHKISLLFYFILISLSLPGQVPQARQPLDKKLFILGEIVEVSSRILNEKRTLNIYLPPGYNPKDTIKYPVVYLLDGSADEDFIHVVGLYQFTAFEWINMAPKSIIVGIATVDRRRDFTFPTTIDADKKKYPTTGHSGNFIQFMENELMPYVEKNYKTSPATTLIGQSLGGLLATEVLLKKPALFSRYIIVSPSLWWDNGSLLSLETSPPPRLDNRQTDVYIGVGKEGLTPTAIPRVMEVDANLLAEKIKKGRNKALRVYFDYLPEEDHATIAHQAIYNALRLFSSRK